MEEVVAANVPSGFTLEWSGQSREEKSSSDATLKIMGLSLLFVFFCLAALEAAKLRLRPIIMTSLAFIIGCLPLALAPGAGAAARNSMGTAVVGGMLFATALGIFLIPVFFVLVEAISAKLGMISKFKRKTSADYM